MKFPYGIADFYKVITGGYFYVDRTSCIPQLESAGEQLLFLRPRRFGKSLLLSMLENYYDLRKADEFERLFGGLAIGQQPTPLRNQYFVLKWDFSAVNPHGDADAIEGALHDYLNDRIADFAAYYEGHLARPIEIAPANALSSFQSLLTAVRLTPRQLYLLIDEYDNFANEILMSAMGANRQHYESLLRGTGVLKTVFKVVKAAASGGGLDRVFITGVAPLVMTDLSSGYNVAQSIHLSPHFADLCGFTEAEISQAFNSVVAGCGLTESDAAEALTQMRLYYNGYRFAEGKDALIYNPTLALYFLQHFQENCRAPREMLDDNLAMDPGKLAYLAALPSGAEVVVRALNDDASLSANLLVGRFGVQDVRAAQQDVKFMVSLFYFLGMLTLSETNAFGDVPMRIPNLVIRKLYLERLQESFLPLAADQIASRQAAQDFQRSGDLQPLCDFIEQRYFKVLSNRDYQHANELTLKTAFLTLLFNDTLYIMDSETPAGRRYADLTLIVRPDARQYRIFDLLLECKFARLNDLRLSGEAVQALSRAELAALPLVKQKLAEARAQAPAYRREVEQRYQSMLKMQLRLRTFAVVAVGFDRLVWEEIGETPIIFPPA
jgi:hypothetical protein